MNHLQTFKDCTNWIMWRVFFALLGMLFLLLSPFARDDSDAGGGWGDKRSGMGVHVDALTGCQYLSRSNVLTPRLDATGKQICTKDTP